MVDDFDDLGDMARRVMKVHDLADPDDMDRFLNRPRAKTWTEYWRERYGP